MATFSLSGQYLISRVRADDTSSNTSEVPTTSNNFWWNPLSTNKWDWLRAGLLADSILDQPTKPLTPTLSRWISEGRCFFKDDTKSWPLNLFPSDSKALSEPLTHTTTLDTLMINSESPQGELPPQEPSEGDSTDTIHRLLQNPTLYDPIRAPRFPIVLCHG
ncbi:hypothetical protein BDR07DRAFT_1399851 [Suillus spraguei]|nr:hypothetical protein BDR07DRAFT_1399851 [Suillus spraguei]